MLLTACIMFWSVAAQSEAMANPIRLGEDGLFRTVDGDLFVPLGGFHGNVIPIDKLTLTDEEKRQFEPHLWQGHVDLFDATLPVLHQWFRFLSDNGVTALRLFPRARVGTHVLDLCGQVSPELRDAFHRAFAVAEEYGIHFLLQIMPEPGRTGYLNRQALERHVLPNITDEEMQQLTPAQRRFVLEKRTVSMEEYFGDADVLACQKLYLERVLEWVASEKQIFALEIYNEQGWTGMLVDGEHRHAYGFPWEEDEINWTAEIVRAIKSRLPEMPVCLSHPGFGVTGMDPLKWCRATGVDFYSSHLYAGLCGADSTTDFAAVTAATTTITDAEWRNFPGEWGILNSQAPPEIRRLGHRDAIWLTLTAGAGGFMQWEYDFPEEYRWPRCVIQAVSQAFRPQRPSTVLDIAPQYATFQQNDRYPGYNLERWFSPWEFNRAKQRDANLRQILSTYQHALELGIPVRFAEAQGEPLEDFLARTKPTQATPVQVLEPYQMSYLMGKEEAFLLGYLRCRQIQQFGGHFLGIPTKASLGLRLDMPEGDYILFLIRLGQEQISEFALHAPTILPIAEQTDEDYVFILVDPGRSSRIRQGLQQAAQ